MVQEVIFIFNLVSHPGKDKESSRWGKKTVSQSTVLDIPGSKSPKGANKKAAGDFRPVSMMVDEVCVHTLQILYTYNVKHTSIIIQIVAR